MKQFVCVCLCICAVACGSGEVVHEGNLDPSDNKLSLDGSAYDWFKVEIDANQSLVATVKSEAFEPTLFLFNADHKQVLEQPGSQGISILNYSVETAGSYSLMVNAIDPSSSGSYVLTVRVDDP